MQFGSKPWRAMLIKDNEGDWGLCAAAWFGMEPGIPGKPGTRWQRPVRGVPGKPGYFKMLFKNLRLKEKKGKGECLLSALNRFLLADVEEKKKRWYCPRDSSLRAGAATTSNYRGYTATWKKESSF